MIKGKKGVELGFAYAIMIILGIIGIILVLWIFRDSISGLWDKLAGMLEQAKP